MKTKLLILLALILVGGGVAAFMHFSSAPVVKTTLVRMLPVDRGTVESQIRVTGVASSDQKSAITAEDSGRAVQVLVQVGSVVKKGDVVLKMDTDDIAAELAVLKMSAQQAQTEIDRRKVQLESIRRDYQAGGEARDRVKDMEAQVQSAQNQRDKVTIDMKRLQVRQTHRTVVSAVSGTITNLDIHAGEFVQAGKPLATVVPADALEVLAKVEPGDATLIKEGMKVLLSVDGRPTEVSEERVLRFNPSVQKDGNNEFLGVWVSLTPGKLSPRPNQQLDVKIQTGSPATVTRIPAEALVTKSGKSNVWLVNGGKLALQPVVIGVMGDKFAEITSGLSVGQTVAVSDGELLKEGATAEVAKPAAAAVVAKP